MSDEAAADYEFHPIEEHRWFCPWVSAESPNLAGWEKSLEVLLKAKSSETGSPVDVESGESADSDADGRTVTNALSHLSKIFG